MRFVLVIHWLFVPVLEHQVGKYVPVYAQHKTAIDFFFNRTVALENVCYCSWGGRV